MLGVLRGGMASWRFLKPLAGSALILQYLRAGTNVHLGVFIGRALFHLIGKADLILLRLIFDLASCASDRFISVDLHLLQSSHLFKYIRLI